VHDEGRKGKGPFQTLWAGAREVACQEKGEGSTLNEVGEGGRAHSTAKDILNGQIENRRRKPT